MTRAAICAEDIASLAAYERARDAYLRDIVVLKARRRVCLGDVTLTFECRETVLFQIHEVLRLAHDLAPVRMREEIEEYIELVPRRGQLAATVFVHGGAPGWVRRLGTSLTTTCDALELHVDGRPAIAEPVRPPPDPSCPVHYVRFRLDPRQLARLQQSGARASVSLRCGAASAVSSLSSLQLAELSCDALPGPPGPSRLFAHVARG